jgi:hypothetical protein
MMSTQVRILSEGTGKLNVGGSCDGVVLAVAEGRRRVVLGWSCGRGGGRGEGFGPPIFLILWASLLFSFVRIQFLSKMDSEDAEDVDEDELKLCTRLESKRREEKRRTRETEILTIYQGSLDAPQPNTDPGTKKGDCFSLTSDQRCLAVDKSLGASKSGKGGYF